jgi:hypothetical protein
MIFSHRRSAPLDAKRELWGWEPRASGEEKAPTQQNLLWASRVRFAEGKKIILPRYRSIRYFFPLALDPQTKSCCPDPAFSKCFKRKGPDVFTSGPLVQKV